MFGYLEDEEEILRKGYEIKEEYTLEQLFSSKKAEDICLANYIKNLDLIGAEEDIVKADDFENSELCKRLKDWLRD